MARSSRICGISGAQSLKILRQITAADCGQSIGRKVELGERVMGS